MADCCKECSSSEAWDGEMNDIKPLKRKKWMSFFSFTWTWSQHLKSIHMILHSGWLWFINLRCMMCMLKREMFVWIGFFITGIDPNSLGAGPGTQNNMLLVIQSGLLSQRANENHGKRTVQQFVQMKSRLVYFISSTSIKTTKTKIVMYHGPCSRTTLTYSLTIKIHYCSKMCGWRDLCFWMKVFSAHQGCIYLIKKCSKIVKYYNI